MYPSNNSIKVALIYDQQLLRIGIAYLINRFENCSVCLETSEAAEVIQAIKGGNVPDVIILSLGMPKMEGYDVAVQLRANYPTIPIIITTSYASEFLLVRFIKIGVQSVIINNIHPDEFKLAIQTVCQTGVYYQNNTTRRILNILFDQKSNHSGIEKYSLNDQESTFLKLVSKEITYKQIATQMNKSLRTIDKMRDDLFMRFDIRCRVGLVMLAIKSGLFEISN